jgi:hypothetical protein
MTTTPFVASPEQLAVIEAGLVGQRVIACAGSGKTATSVRRLAEVRRQMGASRQYVALLSYSNVAVDTFRREYAALAKGRPGLSSRVLVCTVDSFVTSHILSTHSSATMGCTRQPFLVHGHEPFLKGFTFFNGTYGENIDKLTVSFSQQGDWMFHNNAIRGNPVEVPEAVALAAIRKLGKTGAYTHELGRYWSIETLAADDRLHKILAYRYPHILVDEAQDISNVHGVLLSILMDAGATVSLIGDPNQAIYEFANADGSFLGNFEPGAGGLKRTLSQNRRSIKPIVDVANNICGASFTTTRQPPTRKHGAYLVTYKDAEIDKLLPTFAEILQSSGYSHDASAVLCRGRDTVPRIAGACDQTGQGATEKFARAAICRDRKGDIAEAFEFAVDGVLRVLSSPPPSLRSAVINGAADTSARELRRLVWAFLRSPTGGIPSAKSKAKDEWHPALKNNLEALLTDISEQCGLSCLPTWKKNVTTRGLGDAPLWEQDLLATSIPLPPIKTVHQAKGESIDAVMYVLKSRDVKNVLAGPIHEEGRIGYVGLTRARDLLIVAVLDTTALPVIAQLKSKGLDVWC